MNPIIKNILAVLAGVLVGNLVNGGLIMISPTLIPPPEGVDVRTAEGLKAGLHLFEPKHFIMPFLAHALGTFAGALITVLIAASHHLKLALLVGALFLLAGVATIFMIPSPLWFTVVDLLLAYIPMAYIGHTVAQNIKAAN